MIEFESTDCVLSQVRSVKDTRVHWKHTYDYVLGQVLPVNDPPGDWSQLNLYWAKKCQ